MTFGRIFILGLLFSFFGATWVLHAETLRRANAIVCVPGTSERLELDSTERIPGAHGLVTIECNQSTAAIDVELSRMKPATLFGGDYNTYILWAASPDERIENLGEFILNGTRSRLHASTKLNTFAILVTAEPHFLVRAPSAFVVLESASQKRGEVMRYQVLEGVYNFERATLENVKHAKGRVQTIVKQAVTAVRLAQRAGAVELAADELIEADHTLDRTFDLMRHGQDRNEIEALARETVRLAVAARSLALDRAFLNARIGAEGSGRRK